MQVTEKLRNWIQIKFANLIPQLLTYICPDMNLIDFSHSPLKRKYVLVSWKTAPRKSSWEIIKIKKQPLIYEEQLISRCAMYTMTASILVNLFQLFHIN